MRLRNRQGFKLRDRTKGDLNRKENCKEEKMLNRDRNDRGQYRVKSEKGKEKKNRLFAYSSDLAGSGGLIIKNCLRKTDLGMPQ